MFQTKVVEKIMVSKIFSKNHAIFLFMSFLKFHPDVYLMFGNGYSFDSTV